MGTFHLVTLLWAQALLPATWGAALDRVFTQSLDCEVTPTRPYLNFGFRFQASDGLLRYGYGRVDVGATANVRTLAYVEWESTPGIGIQIPAPGALALAAIAGFGRSRRRR
jgi:hypothetical protein